MALRIIRKDNEPVLRKMSKNVEVFDEKLKILVEDMTDTMYDADGVGLAAPQIGILKRVVVIDVYDDFGVRVLINPAIMASKGEQHEIEGCLSVPGMSGRVKRPAWVKVSYQDINGTFHEIEGTDLLCRALCHEIDHLNGIIFTDIAETLSDDEDDDYDDEEDYEDDDFEDEEDEN